MCRLIEAGEILVWPWKFPKWGHMSEVRVGASSTMLDSTHKNCVGLLLLFVSVASWGHRGWQTDGFEDLVGRQPTPLIRPDTTVRRREDTWRRGCRVWSRSFGELGGKGYACLLTLFLSGAISSQSLILGLQSWCPGIRFKTSLFTGGFIN